MSLAVVRCPACGGASRVSSDALGQMVGCPRCQAPFVAAADAPAGPLPSRSAAAPERARPKSVRPAAKPRPTAVVPIAPPRRPHPAPAAESEPAPVPVEAPDPEHDPHTPHIGGLPASVLVGFALMPFGIPLLWFVGPLVTRSEAALSLAVPVSLALAAAALCLGVVYTIDWTATTRIKGVLMLVSLAYLSAAGLYFLKKDLMDRVQGLFSAPILWAPAHVPESRCLVKMPGPPTKVREQPFPLEGGEWADGVRAEYRTQADGSERTYSYFAAVSKARARPVEPDDDWFDGVGRRLKEKGQLVKQERLRHEGGAGCEWELKVPGDNTVRIVRVFVIQGRVYCLCAEGPELAPTDEDLAKPFFDSFAPTGAK